MRLIKWIYDLGVQHERERVKRVIEIARRDYAQEINMFNDQWDKFSDTKKKKADKVLATHNTVTGILDKLTETKEEHILTRSGGSLLEPNKEK